MRDENTYQEYLRNKMIVNSSNYYFDIEKHDIYGSNCPTTRTLEIAYDDRYPTFGDTILTIIILFIVFAFCCLNNEKRQRNPQYAQVGKV